MFIRCVFINFTRKIFRKMPRKYIRKTNRGSWSQENLELAIQSVTEESLSINQASKLYNIPNRTLRRRIKANNSTKLTLGKHPGLGFDNEKRLVAHIQRLQAAGFAPSPKMVRGIAYGFAKSLGRENIFGPKGSEEEMAGIHWFRSFMDRQKDLSIRVSEGLSLARAKGMNRKEVNDFFDLLQKTLTDNNLENQPHRIFNMDETGIQLTNVPGKVVAIKGSKCVQTLTPKEKGESISIIACMNAEGVYLPPVLIMKGVRKFANRIDGLPPASDIYMNKKSSYINAELFLKWFKEIFLPRKPKEKVLLILDGHTSHCNNYDLHKLAEDTGVVLLCLPSHTTQALQPLDRTFFKPFKTYYKQEAQDWIFSNKDRTLNRDVVGKLIGNAWKRAATVQNAISGFDATGIYPFNRNKIPDYFFEIHDNSVANNTQENLPQDFFENDDNYVFLFENENENISNDGNVNDETPSKFLHEVAPVPMIPINQSKRKMSARILVDSDDNSVTQMDDERTDKGTKNEQIQEPLNSKSKGKAVAAIKKKNSKVKKTKVDSQNEEEDTNCVECLESYFQTVENVDWIQCVTCKEWLHETCTMYGDYCNNCGKIKKRQENGRN